MKSSLPVVILCGGYGTRLSEETILKPKPMVEIGPYPILYHIMKHYSYYGHKHFILGLGYKADYIKQYFYNLRITLTDFTLKLDPRETPQFHNVNDESDWEITFVDTGLNTLKGGRIKRLSEYIDSDKFFLTYGDAVSNVNLNKLLEFHNGHERLATLTGVLPPSRFGELSLEGDSVTTFEEKPQLTTGVINGGYFVLDRTVLDYLSEDESCDFEFGPLQQIALDGDLMCYKHTDFWQCMDTMRDKNYLNKLWENNTAPWKIWQNKKKSCNLTPKTITKTNR